MSKSNIKGLPSSSTSSSLLSTYGILVIKGTPEPDIALVLGLDIDMMMRELELVRSTVLGSQWVPRGNCHCAGPIGSNGVLMQIGIRNFERFGSHRYLHLHLCARIPSLNPYSLFLPFVLPCRLCHPPHLNP